MKKYSFLLVTVVLFLLFGKLVLNYKDRYTFEHETIVLEESTKDSTGMVDLLVAKNYLPTHEDAEFAVKHLRSRFEAGAELASLYDLNKREWKIPSELIEKSGTDHYRDLLAYERVSMGLDEEYRKQEKKELPSVAVIDEDCSGSIVVQINSVDEKAGFVSKLLRSNKQPSSDVVVRLYEHYITEDNAVGSRILAHARTDDSGLAVFEGLDISLSYSVIPIKEGYEYGSSQGTTEGSLEKSGDDGVLECSFVQNEHKIKVFSNNILKNIKSDHNIVVRSLSDFMVTMAIYMAIFFAIWWLFMFFYKRRNPGAETGIMSLIMMLTGICLLMMFSINDPLNDKIIGIDMAQGVIAGVVIMILLQFVNFTRFYQGKSRLPFDIPAEMFKLLCWPFGLRKKADAMFDRLPKGFGYMAVALLLTMLLFTPLGASVGGMRVNLNVGILFQPSEIAKYLIVIFIAAFFCANADKIVKFSNKGNVDLFGAKMKMLGAILLGLIFLMGLYLLLGDMGPAMVLSFTFIIMYSIIKSKVDLEGLTEKQQMRHILTCDLAMLVYGVLSFVLMLYVGSIVGLMWVFCLAWFALWIIIGLLKKRVFESAIVFNLIIAAFVFGASIMKALPGLDSVAERLESRNEMCTNTWGVLPVDGQTADPGENTQVAEGLWGLASGGVMGQGIGQGSPSSIPAFHTDMILSSIGEQTGFIGLLIVVILLVMLLRKTVLQGYRTAHPFTFYLCLGIAVVTGVQFIIIALGSTGIIPLTGVTVPFFSFGKVSMILNLAAFGIVISIAGRNAHAVDASEEVVKMRRDQMKKYDYSIALTSLSFTLVSLFILGVYFKYQVWDRDEILIRPVYVNNNEGYPVVDYNPRIAQIAEKMPIGNIYDRNGVLLATSDVEAILKNKYKYIGYGVDKDYLDDHLKQRLRRYYPFGEHLFFMLGDYNTRFMFTSSGTRGYFAEHEHLSQLRGYDDRLQSNDGYLKVNLESDSFKPGKFYGADSSVVAYGVQLRDYSALLPSLKSGKNIGTQPQEIHLTLDAVLQTDIQNRLADYVKKEGWRDAYPAMRISVVILDANSGDLVASAAYPLPDQEYLQNLKEEELSRYSDNNRPTSWRSYTDMDLGLVFPTYPGSSAKILTSTAALQKVGSSVIDSKIKVYKNEVIRRGEPGTKGDEMIDMKTALDKSSNLYFIHLMNQYDLYSNLFDIYEELNFTIDKMHEIDIEKSLKAYDRYINKGEKKKLNHNDFPRSWSLAWGQGGLHATPLGMARAMAITVNGGRLPYVRYTDGDTSESKVVLDATKAKKLKEMLNYADDIGSNGKTGGKTGTAERTWVNSKGVKNEHYNDGWFVFYVENAKLKTKGKDKNANLSVAVRIERGLGSGKAKTMAKELVLPLLTKE